MQLQEALAKLDPSNDDHWTSNGSPRIDVVREMTGDSSLSRQDITDASPSLTRETAGSDDSAEVELDVETAERADPDPNQVELGEEEILAMDMNEATASIEAMDQYLAAVTNFCNRQSQIIDEAKTKMDDYARRSDIVSRIRERARKANPNNESEPIRRYLDQQNKVREERAARAKKFMEAGTSAEDVVKQISGKAPIDAALNQRKAAPGSTRPALGTPVRK